MKTVEESVREQLRRQAEHVVVGDGWSAIHHRIERRCRRRRARRAVVTVATVSILCAGAVTLAGKEGQGRQVTNPAAPASALPRLVLGLPGLEFESAFSHDLAFVEPLVKQATNRLYVVTEPGRGFEGRVLFVSTMGKGGPGSRPIPIGEPVVIGDRPATLEGLGGGLSTWALIWQAESGSWVRLTSVRMTAEELVAAAEGMVVDHDGGMWWREGSPPPGLAVLRAATPASTPQPSAAVAYAWHGGHLTLRLQKGWMEVVDEMTSDRLGGARDLRQVTVGDERAAWIETAEGGVSVIWPVRPGIAAELVAGGVAREQIEAALASIHEIPESRWDALLKLSQVKVEAKAEEVNADLTAGLAAEFCRLRSTWLGATATGDIDARAKLAATGVALFDKASAAGSVEGSDQLQAARTLVRAMQIGDREVVLSSRPGGCP